MCDGESFRCPRRVTPDAGAPDHWTRDRWTHDGAVWPDDSPMPRACSHCGAVHPDDAIDLLAAGWVIELTDKKYKLYLSPGFGAPGSAVVPPVKVYLMHWTAEQTRRADDVVKARRAFIFGQSTGRTN